ncbi:liver stage associated protein 1, putative [Plasmodium knowlesi strain H]|uniref:Liver stage associated protein 1, putative n=3 Tax=Plasmodium knowlesi TaxID=5850 RepID=A0A1A7VUD9_PLAKH|nr:uncharacterized protein PKNH_1301200 [Plasmodium knowlesi strain H]OTN66899.1 putative Liver stage associated protein 1 [Plasmodium knowlesi]CAA9990052.1 early transcribed membrane protein [Plasmodium knowlesi strain H]SBO25709.1 liver stage associated protein 1, putative [Plasmodium knowlesi strain H]SBO28524.1 liver stage associated protein 1, putative [Plasmodium knowlesi strain H]VVS79526.1 early transcribed membrane protein [Plasmodium knowlesi strain H]
MKASNHLSVFLLFLFLIAIIPCLAVYSEIPIEKLDYETIKVNEKIRSKSRKDVLMMMSLVCGSIVLAYATIWGMRIHHTLKFDQRDQIPDHEIMTEMEEPRTSP